MKSVDIPILQQLSDAAKTWQTTAASVGVVITTLTTTIGGEVVRLSWIADQNAWEIHAD